METRTESLFDVGEMAWRVEVRAKGGGGPFDPAGFDLMLIDDSGAMIAMDLYPRNSKPNGPEQLLECLAEALVKVSAILEDRALLRETNLLVHDDHGTTVDNLVRSARFIGQFGPTRQIH